MDQCQQEQLLATARAEGAAAEREKSSAIITAATALIAAMETCHECGALLELDQGPQYCEDHCSIDCDVHPPPECLGIGKLHENLKAAIRARAEA